MITSLKTATRQTCHDFVEQRTDWGKCLTFGSPIGLLPPPMGMMPPPPPPPSNQPPPPPSGPLPPWQQQAPPPPPTSSMATSTTLPWQQSKTSQKLYQNHFIIHNSVYTKLCVDDTVRCFFFLLLHWNEGYKVHYSGCIIVPVTDC